MQIRLHDPVIVSQAPASLRGWGPWQFPLLLRLGDGRLLLEYHCATDSAQSYGLPAGQCVSADGGATWQELPPPGITAGLRLPGGEELRAIQKPSLPTSGLELPEPLAILPSSYPLSFHYYRWGDLPAKLRNGWWFRRRAAGSAEWSEEQARLDLPDPLVYTSEDVFVVPFLEQDRIHLAPDGRLLAALYTQPQLADGRFIVRRFLAMLIESLDGGRTWQLKGKIPYCPDMRADPLWDARDGFTEPQIVFLSDQSMLVFLRSSDGNGVGPLYWARSLDGGSSWSRPAVFDHIGVWPQACVLADGTILVAYGRPGLFVRAALDPSARRWSKRKVIVPPGEPGRDTCSYSSLLALPAGGALIAYSDFNVPDGLGNPRKTILVRRIEVG
jgi:hypothetical protein